jgi:hypothetical protein
MQTNLKENFGWATYWTIFSFLKATTLYPGGIRVSRIASIWQAVTIPLDHAAVGNFSENNACPKQSQK